MSASSRPEPHTAKSSHRLPPPFLFQGPPSRNISNLSLPSGLLPGSHASGKASPATQGAVQPPPLSRQSSARAEPGDLPRLGSPFARHSQGRRQSEVDAADALWEEMQNTLADVELSAANSAHVFGENHSKALEELRVKQLALAQAWARTETEEVAEGASSGHEGDGTTGTKSAASEALRSDSVGGDTGTTKAGNETTEKDILLARKRREANDRYFDRVNSSVLDVVAKLEEVAEAMRAVERASKEIWSEEGSVTSAGESNG
ncbi:hypothetical protein VTO42DRAFT_6443 [Malbranchea cinnamomea]